MILVYIQDQVLLIKESQLYPCRDGKCLLCRNICFFYSENIFRYDESLHIKYPELISDIGLWADSYRCKWTDVSY